MALLHRAALVGLVVIAAFLVLAGGVAPVHAQANGSADASTGPATQIWATLTVAKPLSDRWHLDLDVEPKWQVTSGEHWRSVDLTPRAAYDPADWLDLEAETLVGNTRQRDGLDTVELTPRVGARFHLFAKMAPHRPDILGLEGDRLPLTRLGVSTLARLEWRNLFYSDDTPDSHQWRARLRVESKLALNHAKLSEDRILYATADAEYYVPLGDDVPEAYVNRVRVRLGLGYRRSKTRVEFLYVRDWNRASPGASTAEDVRAFDLRVNLVL